MPTKSHSAESLSIGRLAAAAGVGIDTVRYYERSGLLPAPPRRASGYRAYPADSLARLRFIRRAKALGFALDEIAALLRLSQPHERDAGDVRQLAQARLQEVEAKIAELQRVRAGLRQLVKACPGRGSLRACPIIAALSDGART